MAGQSSQDLLQQTVNGFAAKVQEYADGIAGRLGQPLSGTQLTQDEAVARWNFSPLGSTTVADQAYHQLVAQGTPPGQALDQVYPMRSLLFRGADTQEAISNARQIAGWAANATGSPPPEEPKTSTLPLLMAQQQPAQAPQNMPMPMPAPVAGPPLPPIGGSSLQMPPPAMPPLS